MRLLPLIEDVIPAHYITSDCRGQAYVPVANVPIGGTFSVGVRGGTDDGYFGVRYRPDMPTINDLGQRWVYAGGICRSGLPSYPPDAHLGRQFLELADTIPPMEPSLSTTIGDRLRVVAPGS